MLKTGFTVTKKTQLAASSCMHMRICVHVGTPLHTLRIRVAKALVSLCSCNDSPEPSLSTARLKALSHYDV